MPDDLSEIKTELQTIKSRNARVEAEKAWETSIFRISSIVTLTYLVALVVLYGIGNDHPLRNALIPALGYFLSTQSLPFVKSWWIRNFLKKKGQ